MDTKQWICHAENCSYRLISAATRREAREQYIRKTPNMAPARHVNARRVGGAGYTIQQDNGGWVLIAEGQPRRVVKHYQTLIEVR